MTTRLQGQREEDRTASGEYSDHLARWLSHILHPVVLSTLTLLVAIYLDTGSPLEAVLWTAICVAAFLVPMSAFILVMVGTGRYSDVDVSIREQRHSLYLVGGGCLLLLVAVFVLGGAPRISSACACAAVCGAVASAVLNRFFKVSLHAMITAGCAAALFHLSLPAGLVLSAIAGTVGWSRVQLGHHTWPQVIAGWATAVACVVLVFYLYL